MAHCDIDDWVDSCLPGLRLKLSGRSEGRKWDEILESTASKTVQEITQQLSITELEAAVLRASSLRFLAARAPPSAPNHARTKGVVGSERACLLLTVTSFALESPEHKSFPDHITAGETFEEIHEFTSHGDSVLAALTLDRNSSSVDQCIAEFTDWLRPRSEPSFLSECEHTLRKSMTNSNNSVFCCIGKHQTVHLYPYSLNTPEITKPQPWITRLLDVLVTCLETVSQTSNEPLESYAIRLLRAVAVSLSGECLGVIDTRPFDDIRIPFASLLASLNTHRSSSSDPLLSKYTFNSTVAIIPIDAPLEQYYRAGRSLLRFIQNFGIMDDLSEVSDQKTDKVRVQNTGHNALFFSAIIPDSKQISIQDVTIFSRWPNIINGTAWLHLFVMAARGLDAGPPPDPKPLQELLRACIKSPLSDDNSAFARTWGLLGAVTSSTFRSVYLPKPSVLRLSKLHIAASHVLDASHCLTLAEMAGNRDPFVTQFLVSHAVRLINKFFVNPLGPLAETLDPAALASLGSATPTLQRLNNDLYFQRSSLLRSPMSPSDLRSVMDTVTHTCEVVRSTLIAQRALQLQSVSAQMLISQDVHLPRSTFDETETSVAAFLHPRTDFVTASAIHTSSDQASIEAAASVRTATPLSESVAATLLSDDADNLTLTAMQKNSVRFKELSR